MSFVRIFVPTPVSDARVFRLFDQTQKSATAAVLFKDTPSDFSIEGYRLVTSPHEADFFALSQPIKQWTHEKRREVEKVVENARVYGKDTLVFLTGDYCHRIKIDIPHVVVFTGSAYKKARRSNEIVFAPFTEDLGDKYGISSRVKEEKPTISFCGYASYPHLWAELKSQALHVFLEATGRAVYKRGISFRKSALNVLRKDARFKTHFIVRSFFSGNADTITTDAQQIRKEYIDSLQQTDFVLCPKGDANFSSRFYETLSLGRIPVLIDTDMILPFENQIDYSQFIIRVPYTDIDRVGDYVMDVWEQLSDEEYIQMQTRARDTYRNYLRFDAYFNRALPLLKSGGIEAVL